MTRDRLRGFAILAPILCRALTTKLPDVALHERLATLPRHLPCQDRVTIHWDDRQIPFVEATNAADLAVGLGVVHAHLRHAQMEVLRRVSQGRLAEVLGPLVIEVDRTARLFDFGRAVPEIIAALSADVRSWAEGFLRGVNHVVAHAPLPPELQILGVGREPWSMRDLFTAARLAGADVSWIVWARLLPARDSMGEDDWNRLWPRLLGGGGRLPDDAAAAALGAFARTGSNAAAVAGWRSASGSALLAADPHLSIALPNVWLACGMHAPGIHAVGLMPAGFPIIAIGRNRHIAWAGTSLHAASSELFEASTLQIRERDTTIRVRGGRDRVLKLRETELGPIISDGLVLRSRRPLALAWVGHRATDEMGAMLGVMRAASGAEFRTALGTFGIPAQNMIYAEAGGRVGHLLAARLPRRPSADPADLVAHPDQATEWRELAGTEELPHWPDPDEGFVASANDRPAAGAIPVGFFFSPSDRVKRLRELLAGERKLNIEDLIASQLDVLGEGALRLRDMLLSAIQPETEHFRAARALRTWDGSYGVDSEGAAAFELTLAAVADDLGKGGAFRPFQGVWTTRSLIAEEIGRTEASRLVASVAKALDHADRELRRHGNWGGLHRLRLRHQLGAAPLIGRRFRYSDHPSPGGNDTLNKTGHGPVSGRHAVSYGASARFVTDLADLDASRVVLLGGQDGWIGSTTFRDQAEAWRAGRMFALPMRLETVRAWPHRTVFTAS